ncbi:Uncharacterised protein [Chlamydia trachomatis]|nr:Uncharacterised protein [Chlamydia trachomatis]
MYFLISRFAHQYIKQMQCHYQLVFNLNARTVSGIFYHQPQLCNAVTYGIGARPVFIAPSFCASHNKQACGLFAARNTLLGNLLR